MNAGCYGCYVADHCVSVEMVLRDGRLASIPAEEVAFQYRQSDLPEGVVVAATFRAETAAPAALEAKMAEQIAKAGCKPADQGPLRWIDLPQSRRVLVDRQGR